MYKKTVIRQFFVEYLKAQITQISNRVFAGRIDPLTKNETFPYLVVMSKNDEVTDYVTGYTEREMDLLVSVNIRSNQEQDSDFDALVEDLMFRVEEAMSKQITIPSTYTNPEGSNLDLFKNALFERSQINNNTESGNDYGSAVMAYKIEYDYEDPIVPLTLEDFDWQGSIDNIQITNVGVQENV